MVVLGFVEGDVLGVVLVGVTHVVGYDVEHEPDVSFSHFFEEVDEFLFGSEVIVDFVDVHGGVTVEMVGLVFGDWRYPDCIES